MGSDAKMRGDLWQQFTQRTWLVSQCRCGKALVRLSNRRQLVNRFVSEGWGCLPKTVWLMSFSTVKTSCCPCRNAVRWSTMTVKCVLTTNWLAIANSVQEAGTGARLVQPRSWSHDIPANWQRGSYWDYTWAASPSFKYREETCRATSSNIRPYRAPEIGWSN